ncbi:MAG: hypothetical protein ACRCT1_19145 [Microcoleaceae cyanobacterium]
MKHKGTEGTEEEGRRKKEEGNEFLIAILFPYPSFHRKYTFNW